MIVNKGFGQNINPHSFKRLIRAEPFSTTTKSTIIYRNNTYDLQGT